ncbi:MAG: hypothetical protein Aurels2KO_51570 [Aureliella sp.]
MLSDIVAIGRKEFVRDATSIGFLIASNFLPLFGVFAFGWQVFDIVLLYWIENVIIGAFNLVKIATCMPQPEKDGGKSNVPPAGAIVSGDQAIKLFLMPFFTFHYGLFCTVHGIFIVSLLGDELDGGGLSGGASPLAASLEMLKHPGFALVVVGLIASHAVSLVKNYYIGGEYKKTHPMILLFSPYGRIVILHVAILLSAFLTLAFGSPIWMLLLLVVGKTAVDLAIHLAARGITGESKDAQH